MTVGVGSSGCLLRYLVLALLVSVTLGFQSFSSTTKIVTSRNINKLPRFSTPLSLSIHDVIPSSISVALEPLESYYVEQIPDIVPIIVFSLIAGTVILPLYARRKQVEKNSRSQKDLLEKLQEPEDAAGAYEKYYKRDAVNDIDKST
mmetsp:Transcript_5287/g.5412  ORF Transcript_5287/g.5412 Transcript_5287/m.5412 type:complete len:147 (+) Transcript_5287:138-578(+)|eukprot:CAMPEP_0119042052 /NCGR_PEP_ID=MMETSP1177-20130426/14317_1 /TAXON_ID=2985 /ORGANISM="Ochromonas sp, Strain CCMP1899" /LENGTH=146 /DNA_ID=CAMNT_0007008561 /DNA_START=119 /DNA_END=559 /DNA_ORIENTATION=-